MKTTTLAAAVALAVLHVTAQAQLSDTLQKIKSSGTIQLGGRDGSFPFSYKTSADSAPVGFSADLCMKVVDAVKAKLQMPDLKVQYTIVTPLNRIPLVQNGTIDLECSTTTNTAARAQLVQFAPTHFVGSIAAAVKSNSGINSLADLDGKAIATVSGSTSIQVMRAYRRNEKVEFSEVSGKDSAETFLMLSSGRASAMILEDVQLAGLIARASQPSEYKILGERMRDEPYGFMYRKDDPQFAALVDGTLTQVMKSGEIDKIYARWFTQSIAPTGVNLNFPMTDAVREAFRSPNKKPAQ
ncbi:amino acid ABC transporter substrate-binding protein [Acidovorax sp. ACV01]|uniref:amino acid ABC transporter substrate-binding protein n=1 Tax=Acidovorax sp. ACV01 TaxID=2769311 RepID=UPI00177D7791|nr:amino acid ABC transporter substrate-binding protein [Acidovorax sp. ACV01]MBD9394093.1 amino acid ABC transporter substrate-binding protein [Acidovorax sp. ACV01]